MLEATQDFESAKPETSEAVKPASAPQPANFVGEVQNTEEDFGQLAKLGHQETSMILAELEGIARSADYMWIKTTTTAPMLAKNMGYEDVDELEDALKGTLNEFLEVMPIFETRMENGEHHFRLIKSTASGPQQLLINITQISDLYTVVLKPADARIIIPELEFEIGEFQDKSINTIYNHIAGAILNLSLQIGQGTWDSKTVAAVTDTVANLNLLLDVPKPWTFILRDPSGTGLIRPSAKVVAGPIPAKI